MGVLLMKKYLGSYIESEVDEALNLIDINSGFPNSNTTTWSTKRQDETGLYYIDNPLSGYGTLPTEELESMMVGVTLLEVDIILPIE